MASIETSHDVGDVQTGGEHKTGDASPSSQLFPPTPALSRARANSFGIRPALTALQNSFGARRRASSITDDASRCSTPRSPILARFVGLDPRPRTSSTATIVPPGAKLYPPSLALPILELPDESMSRAPRIPSFHGLDAHTFGHDLGFSLGLDPRLSVASGSTVRAQEDSSVNSWYPPGDQLHVDSDRNTTLVSLNDSQHSLSRDPDFPVGSTGLGSHWSAQRVDGALTRPADPPMLASTSHNAPENVNGDGYNLDTEATRYPESLRSDSSPPAQPTAQSDSLPNAHCGASHATQEKDLHLEGAPGGGIPIRAPSALSISSTAVSPTRSSGLVSPARSVAVVSPSRDQSIVTVSPARSVVAVSPTRSTLAPSPMGSLPTSPVAMSTTFAPYSSPNSTSPSHQTMVPVPFPSAAEDNGYTSDDASRAASQYGYSIRDEDYSYYRSDAGTPTLYTGTTNTSPTLSVTRTGTSEAPPALRLGPGIGFPGVGGYAGGGNVHGGAFNLGEGSGRGVRSSTVDSGVSGVEREKDGFGEGARIDGAESSGLSVNVESSGRSIHGESTGRSLRAESSGRSLHAESSERSVNAESSTGTGSGIRARVTSLRGPLSVLIPAFMKRARRLSHRMGGDEDGERPRRWRKGGNAKRAGGMVEGDAKDRAGSGHVRTKSNHLRAETSRARTESSCAYSVSSSHPVSDDEEGDISPTSSHLDLLSADPFASTVALKVGAWSDMYAGRSSSGSTPLPPLPDSVEDHMNAQSEYSGSVYGDDDSEEESSIRIYSHGRGRSLSQPDVYTIPIEPLHQSTTTRRTGRSLDRRRGLGNWRRPALPARPSLPSLSTLTRKNVVVPIPRSAAAARFPAEPWDEMPSKAAPLAGSSTTRGLGSLSLPPRACPSPVRGVPFPRSPMRSLVMVSSESSIAEDEDEEGEDHEDEEDEEDAEDAEEEDETCSRVLSGGEEERVWWSGPSSRATSSRRSSMEELTVSMPVQTDPIVRDSLASTVQPRESVVSEDLAPADRDSLISATSHEEIDVSSEAFLQTLNDLDSLPITPPPAITPPPSSRSSSEQASVEDSTMSGPVLHELPLGAGPRYPVGGAGGMNGGGAGGGHQKSGSGHGGQGGSGGSQGGGYGYGGSGGGYGGNGGNGGNGPRKLARPDTESSESSSESDSESDALPPRRGRDARGVQSMAARSQSMPRAPASSSRAAKRQTAPAKASSDESDDVPLAQRLPTALKAQKSIRLQDKAERDERRQKRLDRMKQRAAAKAAPTGGEGGVAPDELAKRLLSVQVSGSERSRDRSPLPSPMRLPPEPSTAPGGLFPLTARSRTVSNVSHLSRSRTHTRNGSMEQQALVPPPPPPPNPTSLSRSGTLANRRPSAPELPPALPSKTSLSRSGTMAKPRASHENPREMGRSSLSRSGTASRHRGGSKTDDEGESSRYSRSRSMRDPTGARPPMPPIPPMELRPVSARRPSQLEPFVPQVVEQRVYIGDRQRFIVVDIGSPDITAKDILGIAKQRGELEANGAGGWQLWEQSNECGMERPVRDFELINDVLKAWNPEKRVNVLIIRRSQLCGLLKPENIPSSSPIMSGWVMWVSKPGKWSKRWLELKEHGLFVCKNEKGKDQTHLCSLFHFDAYIVTHVARAPKPYIFAAKSIDRAGVFEKEEDSSHIFACDSEIGEMWLSRILLARSYVLQQERTVYSRPSNVGSGLSGSKSMLSRSGTKKSTVSSKTAASQQSGPLVTDLHSSPFAEGSLLARALANGA